MVTPKTSHTQHVGPHRESEELVVLVDESNRPTGVALKSTVHHASTPLHRGFSLFVFDDHGRVLLQRRAADKITWPSFWSNSCCGHEMPGEPIRAAAQRRALFELGIEIADVRVLLPHYRYRAEYGGIVENEFCPVLVGRYDGAVEANHSEVSEHRWQAWTEFSADLRSGLEMTPWCKEEARLLQVEQTFLAFLTGR